jgi:hypothetical protein
MHKLSNYIAAKQDKKGQNDDIARAGFLIPECAQEGYSKALLTGTVKGITKDQCFKVPFNQYHDLGLDSMDIFASMLQCNPDRQMLLREFGFELNNLPPVDWVIAWAFVYYPDCKAVRYYVENAPDRTIIQTESSIERLNRLSRNPVKVNSNTVSKSDPESLSIHVQTFKIQTQIAQIHAENIKIRDKTNQIFCDISNYGLHYATDVQSLLSWPCSIEREGEKIVFKLNNAP